MSARRKRRERAGDGGFVIIGVVIFVIALAILGVSLFSLSSIEAEFFGRTENETQELYSAEGGLEWARAVLASEERLEAVAQIVRDSLGIVAAQAGQRQNGVFVTSGPVQWNSPDSVWVRVTAAVGDTTTRTVEAWFKAIRGDEYYKRLITSASKVVVYIGNVGGTIGRSNTLVLESLQGSTRLPATYWQNSTDHSWLSYLRTPPVPVHEIHSSFIPIPNTVEFITRHAAGADTSVHYVPGQGAYDVQSSMSAARFFWTDDPRPTPPDSSYSWWVPEAIDVRVRGLCVWMFPDGVRFNQSVYVRRTGSQPGCLVIVANRNGDHQEVQSGVPYDYRDVGIWFFGGLRADRDIPVILVSNGTVIVEQYNNATVSLEVPELSIFAREVRLSGPLEGVPYSRLGHTKSGLLDQYVNTLSTLEALPNAVAGGAHSLALSPGSWQSD